jgi:hypothetical protein
VQPPGSFPAIFRQVHTYSAPIAIVFPPYAGMVLKIPGYCLQTIDFYHCQLPAFSYL